MKSIFLRISFFLLLNISLIGQALICSYDARDNPIFLEKLQIWLDEIGELTNLEFLVVSMSLERSKVQLIEGKIDMDLGRTSFVYESGAPVIYINPPVLTTSYLLYTADKTIDPANPDTYRNRAMLYPRGNRIVAKWIEDMQIRSYLEIPSTYLGLQMLSIGRGDFLVDLSLFVSHIEKTPSLSAIHSNEDNPVFAADFYLVVHEKHEDKVEALSRAIKVLNLRNRTAELFFSGSN